MKNLWRGITCVCLLFLTACTPLTHPADSTQWLPGQVRGFDLPEDAALPALDIIAIYDRMTQNGFEIRVDLLEGAGADSEITLLIDQMPGQALAKLPNGVDSQGWDQAFTTRLTGEANDQQKEQACSIQWRIDAAAEMFTLQYSCLTAVPRRYQVLITPPGAANPADLSPEISTALTEPHRTKILFAFWDTLPAATPAQNLRRWDGAHTGAFGQRHGLKHLLQAATESNIHLFLLDFLKPESIRGAARVNALNTLTQLARQGYITLVAGEESPPTAAQIALERSNQAAKNLELSVPQVGFAALPYSQLSETAYSHVFADLPDRRHLYQIQNHTLIPLPASVYAQTDQTKILNREGLTRAAKVNLVRAAINPENAEIIIWGGSLPESPWADNATASAAFSWLASHPWVQTLDLNALKNQQALQILPNTEFPCADLLCTPQSGPSLLNALNNSLYPPTETEVVERMLQIADEDLRDLAYEAYLNIMQPTRDPALLQQQAIDFGKIGYLLSAADWLQNPQKIAACTADVNWDNQPECILADSSWFTIIEPQGARLVFAMQNLKSPIILISPPEYQSGWMQLNELNRQQPGLGISQGEAVRFTPVVNQMGIDFSNADQQIRFQLAAGEIEIQAQNFTAGQMIIPLSLIEPAAGSIKLQPACSHQDLAWQCLQHRVSLQMAPPETVQITSADDSTPWMNSPEDPDRAYPPGHYLPYPFNRVNLTLKDNITLKLIVQ